MSSFSSQLVSAVVTTGAYFAGHLGSDIYVLSSRSDFTPIRAVGKTVYYLLPSLERLNYRGAAAHNVAVTAPEILSAIGYGVAYAAVMVALASVIFNRRDFR